MATMGFEALLSSSALSKQFLRRIPGMLITGLQGALDQFQ